MYQITNKIGIVCDMDNELSKRFCYAIADIYQVPKIVNVIPDLVDLDMLFISDCNKEVWTQQGFVEYCNDHNIVVVAINISMSKFKNIYHYTCDITDCKTIELLLKNDMLI